MSGDEKDPEIDTDAIDEAWGEEPAAAPTRAKPPSAKPAPARAARVPRSSKPTPPGATATPVAPRKRQSAALPATAEKKTPRSRRAEPKPLPKLPADDDPIEFEAEAVTRDSIPTFPHPNPLVYDVPPEPEPPPPIPKPPRLPKLPRRK